MERLPLSENAVVRDDGLMAMVYSVEEGRKVPYKVYGIIGVLGDNVVWRLIKSEPASPTDEWLKSEDGENFKKDIEGLLNDEDNGVFDPN